MKHITFTILFLSSLTLFAQNNQERFEKEFGTMKEVVKTLQIENGKLKVEVKTLQTKISVTNKNIENLQQQTQENSTVIQQTANELGVKIQSSETKSTSEIETVTKSLSNRTLFGIIGVLLAIIFSGIIYLLLRKRQKVDKCDLIEQLGKTKTSIEESLVKEFGKQTVLMETQLQLIEKQKTAVETKPNAEPEHSLALKVASEINLIERNISLMDATTKGLKQLTRSVGKLKDNLVANGYEMPELLGKQFNQGMNVIPVSTIPNENLESGIEIISKILIPQVNYNDKMIQAAQVEVSVGY